MEGGLSQWKPEITSAIMRGGRTAKNTTHHSVVETAVPVANYSKLSNPLPEPPSGLKWQRLDSSNNGGGRSGMSGGGKEWALVQVNKDSHSDGHSARAEDDNDCNSSWCLLKHRSNSTVSSTGSYTHTSSSSSPHVISLSKSQDDSTGSLSDYYDNDDDQPDDSSTSKFSYTVLNDQEYDHHNNKRNSANYVEHIILPNDTLQGICIQYKISATKLRQVNCFSGETLLLAPKRLMIPILHTSQKQQQQKQQQMGRTNSNTSLGSDGCNSTDNSKRHQASSFGSTGRSRGGSFEMTETVTSSYNSSTSSSSSNSFTKNAQTSRTTTIKKKRNPSPIRMQDQTTKEYKIHKLMVECPSLGEVESKAYLDLYDWEIMTAIDAATDDLDWERTQDHNNNNTTTITTTTTTKRSNSTKDVQLVHLRHQKVEPNPTESKMSMTDSFMELKRQKEDLLEKATKEWEDVDEEQLQLLQQQQELPEQCRINTEIVNGIHEAVPLILNRSIYNNKIVGIGNDVQSRRFREAPLMEFGIELKEMSSKSDRQVLCEGIMTSN